MRESFDTGLRPSGSVFAKEHGALASIAPAAFPPSHFPTVSVVIPALNEAENLAHVLPRIPAWVHEVLLVDGNSTDGTVDVARSIMPDIRVMGQHGRGKGAALRSGIAAATGEIVVLLDADGSTDPAEIPSFVAALLVGADFAKGSRFLQGAGTNDMPGLRQLGNWALTTLTNLCFGTRYTDITYGYNAFWRKNAQCLALEIDGWANEIVSGIRVARHGLHIVEVPSFEHERIAGQAKLSTFSAGWVILKAILGEWVAAVRNQAPVRSALAHVSQATSTIAILPRQEVEILHERSVGE
ncbi:glycosyltransferase family 2 protein [Chloroflexia bacterium SDU3-3]|nr:glycosyltransferase family 2 protein [Chloroflexia bacterium SDU3-3]